MPRYFMRDTPLQAMEQLMMTQPGQKPRGGGIYRSPFHYTSNDTVNMLDHLRGFIIYDPAFRIVGVLHVAIGRLSHRLACIALDLIADPALFGNVPRIPFVKQIADRGKFVIALGGIV